MRKFRERLMLLHRRAGRLEKRRIRFFTNLWACSISILMVAILNLWMKVDQRGHAVLAHGPEGSSLLSDDVGGYVLVGTLAFMIGTVLAVIFIRFGAENPRGHGKK